MSDRGDTTRDVLLRVRVENLSTVGFGQVSDAVKALTNNLEAQLSAALKLSSGERELTASIEKLNQAARNLTGIATAIDRFKDFDKTLATGEARVESARQKLTDYRTALDSTGDASAKAERTLTQLVKAYEREQTQLATQRQAYADLGAQLQKAGIDTANLAAAEQNLKTVATETGQALTRLNQAKLDYAQNSRLAKEAAAAERLEREATAAAIKAEAAAAVSFNARIAEAHGVSKRLATEENAQIRATLREQMAVNRQKQTDLEAFYANATTQLQRFNEQTRALNRQRVNDPANAAVSGVRAGLLPSVVTPGSTSATTRVVGNAPSLFGLRPYELQNLSYQINDIVSGLAMGQRVSQIFAQQGGQVLQLFNKSIFDVLKYLPAIGIAAGLATVAISALVAAFRDIASIREFNALLRLSADGSRYDSEVFVKLSHDIHALGIDFADTDKILRQSLQTGLNQDRIKEFAEAARGLSDLFPAKFPKASDAFKTLTEDLSEGVDGIRKFNAQFNILSADELKNLRTQKDVADAITLITSRLTEQGRAAVSPLTTATRNLNTTWSDLMTTIGRTESFQGLVTELTRFLTNLNNLVTSIGQLKTAMDALKDHPVIAFLSMMQKNVGLTPGWDLLKSLLGGGTKEGGLRLSGGKYDTAGAPAATADATANSLVVQKWLQDNGYSASATAAIMGNISVESSFNPAARNATGHFGLAQWDTSRQAPLGGSTDIVTQMELLDKELNKLDPAFKTAADSAGVLAARFERVFERSGGQLLDARVSRAEGYAKTTSATPAVANAPGAAFTPDTARVDASTKLIENAERQLKIQYDINEAATRQAIIDESRLKAQKETQIVADQDRLVRIDTEKFDAGRREREIEFQRQLAQLRESDGKNAEAIAAAGLASKVKALADAQVDVETGTKLITLENLRKAEIQGQEEARNRLVKVDQADAERKTLDNQLAALRRTNELKNASSLEQALAAVRDRYVAINAEIDKAAKNPQFTAEEIAKRREMAAALQAVAETQARISAAEAAGKEALAARNELVTSYTKLSDLGEISITEKEEKIKAAFDATRPTLLAAADALQKIIDTEKGISSERVAKLTADIALLRAEAKYIDPTFKLVKDAIENAFSTGLSTAFNTISESIGGLIAKTKTWKDVLVATKDAAIKLVADVLKAVATALLEAEGKKLASSLFGAGSDSSSSTGGIGGLIGRLFGIGGSGGAESIDFGGGGDLVAAVLHGGGIAGRDGRMQRVPASWFDNAPSYRYGTPSVGLGRNEQASILHRGEEVLTEDNPRHIRNWVNSGGSSQGDINIRSVLVTDQNLIPGAMAGSHGERVVIQHLIKNAATVRQLVK